LDWGDLEFTLSTQRRGVADILIMSDICYFPMLWKPLVHTILAISTKETVVYWANCDVYPSLRPDLENFLALLKEFFNIEIEEEAPKKFKVVESELKEEFSTLSKGDGSIDFEDIEKVEKRFGLPPGISGDMEYWKDMKITYEEFVDMLRRNDNIEIKEDAEQDDEAAETEAQEEAETPAEPGIEENAEEAPGAQG